MSNGAILDVFGTMTIASSTATDRVTIGQSNIFQIVNPEEVENADDDLKAMLAIYPSRSWAGYYDHSITQVHISASCCRS